MDASGPALSDVQRAFDAGELVAVGEAQEIEIATFKGPAVGDVYGAIGTYFVLIDVDDASVPFTDDYSIWKARGRRLVEKDPTQPAPDLSQPS